jgi:hypothetical protein
MTPPRRITSRPPPPPGEFMVVIRTSGGTLIPELVERLCANEQEGWSVFYEHCRTKADVCLIRNGNIVARRREIRESVPS